MATSTEYSTPCPKCGSHTIIKYSDTVWKCLSCDFSWDFTLPPPNTKNAFPLFLVHLVRKLLPSQLPPPSFSELANTDRPIPEEIQKLRRTLPITYWLFIPVSRMLKPETREEWIGDFYETVVAEMCQMHYPYWVIDLVAVGRLGLLAIAGVRIFLQDLSPFDTKRG